MIEEAPLNKQISLPKITEEILDQFEGEKFIERDLETRSPRWTQEAVDFVCLLSQQASQDEPDWRTWEKIELAESEVPGWSELEKHIFEQLKIYEGWDDGQSVYEPTDKDKYLIWDFISGLICDDGFFDVVCRVNDPAQDELVRVKEQKQ